MAQNIYRYINILMLFTHSKLYLSIFLSLMYMYIHWGIIESFVVNLCRNVFNLFWKSWSNWLEFITLISFYSPSKRNSCETWGLCQIFFRFFTRLHIFLANFCLFLWLILWIIQKMIIFWIFRGRLFRSWNAGFLDLDLWSHGIVC